MESRLQETRCAANFADHDTFKRRLDELERKIDALPRAIADDRSAKILEGCYGQIYLGDTKK